MTEVRAIGRGLGYWGDMVRAQLMSVDSQPTPPILCRQHAFLRSCLCTFYPRSVLSDFLLPCTKVIVLRDGSKIEMRSVDK